MDIFVVFFGEKPSLSLFIVQITHVMKEIQLFQQTPYRIEHHRRVTYIVLPLCMCLRFSCFIQ